MLPKTLIGAVCRTLDLHPFRSSFVASSLQFKPTSWAPSRIFFREILSQGRIMVNFPRFDLWEIPAKPSGPAPLNNCINTVSAWSSSWWPNHSSRTLLRWACPTKNAQRPSRASPSPVRPAFPARPSRNRNFLFSAHRRTQDASATATLPLQRWLKCQISGFAPTLHNASARATLSAPPETPTATPPRPEYPWATAWIIFDHTPLLLEGS